MQFEHLLRYLKQQLIKENLDLNWAHILISLIKKICDFTQINVETSIDICHYVHVKKVFYNLNIFLSILLDEINCFIIFQKSYYCAYFNDCYIS